MPFASLKQTVLINNLTRNDVEAEMRLNLLR